MSGKRPKVFWRIVYLGFRVSVSELLQGSYSFIKSKLKDFLRTICNFAIRFKAQPYSVEYTFAIMQNTHTYFVVFTHTGNMKNTFLD